MAVARLSGRVRRVPARRVSWSRDVTVRGSGRGGAADVQVSGGGAGGDAARGVRERLP